MLHTNLTDSHTRTLDGAEGPSPLAKGAEEFKVGSLLQQSARAAFGHGVAALQDSKAVGFIAESGGAYPVNTSGGAVTVAPPENPEIGDSFLVYDPTGDWSSNNCSINFVGETYQSAAGALLALTGNYARFHYSGPVIGWVRTDGGGGGGGSSAGATTRILEADWTKTVQDNAFENVTGMVVTLAAGRYAIDSSVICRTTATGDMKYTFTFSGTATAQLYLESAITLTPVALGGALVGVGNNSDDRAVSPKGLLLVTAAGDLQLQAAQNVTTAADLIVRQGTWFRVAPASA